MNNDYWKTRFEDIENGAMANAESCAGELNDILDKAFSSIDKEINSFYQKYANEQGITLADAKQYLNQNDLQAFKADLKDYTRMAMNNSDGRFNQQLDALSARAHIDRLEALQVRTAMHVREAYAKADEEMKQSMGEIMQSTALRSAYEIQNGIGKYEPFHQVDQKSIDRALSKPWTDDGKTFSDRLWYHQTQLVDTLHKEFMDGFTRGVDPQGMTKLISDRFGVAKYAASRLALTEGAYFASEGDKSTYNELGIGQYQILATLDERTSEICQDEDGKLYDVKDYDVGNTAPPFHPCCRSTTIPYIKDTVLGENEKRSAKDADGNYIAVPAAMTYDNWKDVFIDNNQTIAEYVASKATTDDGNNGKITYTERIKKAQAELPKDFTEKDIRKLGSIMVDEMKQRKMLSVYDNAVKQVTEKYLNIDKEYDVIRASRKSGVMTDDEYFSRCDGIYKKQKKVYDYRKKILIRRNEYEQKIIQQLLPDTNADVNLIDTIFSSKKGGAYRYVVNGFQFYPKRWIEELVSSGFKCKTKSKIGARSYFSGNDNLIFLGINDKIETNGSSIHEISHLFEHFNSKIVKLEKEFYERRTAGEDLQRLSDITGNSAYSSFEKSRKDNFLNAYMGKDYGGTYYELLSMGTQMLYGDIGMILTDEDYASFICGILLGV